MELDELTMDEVPLDFTMKKDNCAVSEAEAEIDDYEKFTEEEQLVPLDLSVGRPLPWQLPPSPPPRLQPKSKIYWMPDSPSPTMTMEHLAPLHGMYSNDAAYRHMISTPAIPEYNPSLPILPKFAATQFPQQNHIEPQLQHLDMQQQHLQQLQLQLNQLPKQMLQPKAAYEGIPLDPASMLSGSPVNSSSVSTEGGLDQEHRHRIKTCAIDDMGVPDPEEVAAIYRQPEFVWFRYRYMENLGSPRNFENKRRSRNNNNNNNSSSGNNDDDDHGITPGHQQHDQKQKQKQVIVMKRQKNEVAKLSWDAKRQKYVENQISVKYLTKKLSEMKDIKSRLLKDNNDLLAE